MNRTRIQLYEYGDSVLNKAVSKSITRKYRQLQCIMLMLNTTFKIYLESFPAIMLAIVGFFVFATIRFWHIPFLTYMNFPACAMRCFFESMTPLAIAGQVNEESADVLARWKQILVSGKSKANRDRDRYDNNGVTEFLVSCRNMRCTAGSMYTFENSIVVTTINNTCH